MHTYLFFKKKYLFVYLVVPGLNCGMHVGSSSLTRDQTQAPCTGSAESYPLRHQGSPNTYLFMILNILLRYNFKWIQFIGFMFVCSAYDFFNKARVFVHFDYF